MADVIDLPTSKVCTACQIEKSLDDFFRHPKGRFGRDPRCKTCTSAKQRSRYHANPERYAAQRRKNAGRLRELHLIRSYGIDAADYDAILDSQGGVCAICRESDRRMVVDHDHDSGLTRGILCYTCNIALGMAGDSIERLRTLIDYLQNPPADRIGSVT